MGYYHGGACLTFVACDTETSAKHPDDGGRVVALSVAWRKDGKLVSRAWASPFATRDDWPGLNTEQWCKLVQWLADPRRQLIFHSAKFDLLQLYWSTLGILSRNPAPGDGDAPYWHIHNDLVAHCHWDTLLAQKIMEGYAAAGLKPVAERLWGSGSVRQETAIEEYFARHRIKTKPDRYARLPWNMIEPYARQDARLTLRLFEWQQEQLYSSGNHRDLKLIERELAFMKIVLQMEIRGIGFDTQSSLECVPVLQRRMREIADLLPFRPTPPGAKKYFFGDISSGGQGLEPIDRTKTGQPSLTERELDALARERRPGAALYAVYEKYKSAIGKWYGGWPALAGQDPQGRPRLRPSFNLVRVRSARLSAERVQLHAIPHARHFEVGEWQDQLPRFSDGDTRFWPVTFPRDLFEAKPKHELWEVDLSQGEVRIAAALAHCKAMCAIVSQPGADVHGETARLIFQIDKSDPHFKARRDIAKRINFGMIYGAGARTLTEVVYKETGIQVTEEEMREILDSYRERFPEFYRYAYEQATLLEERGYVIIRPSGKKRYFQFGAPLWESPKDASNAMIQGGLAEAMRDAMIEVDREMPGCLLLQVHDSICLELPKKNAEGMAERARQILINVYERSFRIAFDASAERWADKS